MAVLYASQMASLAFFEALPGSIQLVAGWGIDGGNAVTCSLGGTERVAATSYATELHAGTIRWQYGYRYAGGDDFERAIAQFNCCNGALGSTTNRSFISTLQLNADGSLTYYRGNGPTGGQVVIGTSAPGVVARNGTIHAFQFRFTFPTHASITYDVLVNNVSVLSGTHTTTQSFLCLGGPGGTPPDSTKYLWMRHDVGVVGSSPPCYVMAENTGINHVGFVHHTKMGIESATDHISALVEVIIDDAATPVSYLPGNAVPIELDACAGPPDGGGGPGGGDGGDPTSPPYVAPSYDLDVRYIRRLRRAPHVNQDNLKVFYQRFELDLERGQGQPSGAGSDPQVLLRISRDGGQTWGEEMRMAAGKLGEYTSRVLARRLGTGRDCVFEIVVSDPVSWSIVGAWLELEPGAH